MPYNPDQPRDERGRWGSSSQLDEYQPTLGHAFSDKMIARESAHQGKIAHNNALATQSAQKMEAENHAIRFGTAGEHAANTSANVSAAGSKNVR